MAKARRIWPQVRGHGLSNAEGSHEENVRTDEIGFWDNIRRPRCLQQIRIRRLGFGSRVSCKSLKIKGKVGSGGRDRTADLGVMNHAGYVNVTN